MKQGITSKKAAKLCDLLWKIKMKLYNRKWANQTIFIIKTKLRCMYVYILEFLTQMFQEWLT